MKPYGYVRKDGEGLFIYGEHQFQNATDAELVPVYLKETFLQLIKELRPAITTNEWFDILVQDIEEKL